MRESFGEYYTPSDEDYRKFVKNGLIVLDANVLLAPYRLDSDTRAQVFSILEDLKERIWVPYQAGWEFFENRPNVLSGEDKVYANLQKPLEDAKSSIEAHLKTLAAHPVVTDSEKTRIIRHIDNALTLVKKLSDGRDEKLEDALRSDSILDRWENILEGRIGEPPSDEKHKEYEANARDRYDQEAPPGYLDKKKPANTYGDAILWFELLDHLQTIPTPPSVLLITNDVKEDWYRKQSGRTIGPRVELVREMQDIGVNYYQQRLPAFLSRTSKVLRKQVSREAIRQVTRASGSERFLQYERAVLAALTANIPDILVTSDTFRRFSPIAPDFLWQRPAGPIGIEVMNRSTTMGFKDATYVQGIADSNELIALLVVSPTGFSPGASEFFRQAQSRGGTLVSHVKWEPEASANVLADALFDLKDRASGRRSPNTWKQV